MEEDEQLRIIQMYAQKKQDIADLKIRKENEKFLEKQRKRQVMIDQQIMYLKGLQNKEEEILEKQKQEEYKNNFCPKCGQYILKHLQEHHQSRAGSGSNDALAKNESLKWAHQASIPCLRKSGSGNPLRGSKTCRSCSKT